MPIFEAVMEVLKIHEFTGHTGSVYTQVFDRDTQTLYTAGSDAMVAAWDLQKGGDGTLLVKAANSIYSMQQVEGLGLLLGGMHGNLHLISLEEKKELRNIEAHRQGIFDIVHDAEQHRIYTVGFDGMLHVWDMQLQHLQAVNVSAKSLRSLCLMPGFIALGSSDHAIHLLYRDTLKPFKRLQEHTQSVFALAYNPLAGELLSGGRDCFLKIWDTETFAFKSHYPAATLHINAIAFSPSGKRYVVSSMDKTLKIFDAETHAPLKFIDFMKNAGHTSSVNKTLWIDENTLSSVSDDRKVMVWKLL